MLLVLKIPVYENKTDTNIGKHNKAETVWK